DTNGRKADFRHVILILTTNAGAALMEKNSIGFMTQDQQSEGMTAIQRTFTPEFRNRLDAIIQFDALDEQVIYRVVDKFIKELADRLSAKEVTMEVDS